MEDNCDALGTTYAVKADGEETVRFTGTIGDIGTSSFIRPHHMTMGEGGAVYTKNPLLNKIIRSFRDWGRDCVCPSGRDNLCGHRFDRQYGELPLGYDHKYVYSHFGYNLKATDMQAAIGCAQLDKFPSFVERRRHNFTGCGRTCGDRGQTDSARGMPGLKAKLVWLPHHLQRGAWTGTRWYSMWRKKASRPGCSLREI